MSDFITFHILPKVVEMSLAASVVILIVMLVRLLLKRTPKAFSYALWSIVLFRLLCPISIPTPISVFNVGNVIEEKISEVKIPDEIVIADMEIPIKLQVLEKIPALLSRVSAAEETANAEIASLDSAQAGNSQFFGWKTAGVGTVLSERASISAKTGMAAENAAAETGLTEKTVAQKAAPRKAGSVFATLFTYVWLLGMLILFGANGVRLIRVREKLASSENLRSNIYLCDEISAPFCLGLIRPRIYLPSNLGKLEQKYVLLHEQTHIGRMDHIIKFAAFLALGLHWFNPLVWAAYVLAGKDMEMSCDDVVMRKINGDIRVAYSTSILRLATGQRIETASPLAFGDGDTKQRIENVMNYKKPRTAVIIAAVLICLAAAGCLITDSKEADEYTYMAELKTTTYDEPGEEAQVSGDIPDTLIGSIR